MGNFNRDDRSGGRKNFGRSDFKRRSFGDRGGRREMFKAVCSNCGRDCEVPFRPTGDKPVYCSECFDKRGGRTDSRGSDQRPQNNNQLEEISRKLDKIIEILTITPLKEENVAKVEPEKIKPVEEKIKKTPKKKTSAKLIK